MQVKSGEPKHNYQQWEQPELPGAPARGAQLQEGCVQHELETLDNLPGELHSSSRTAAGNGRKYNWVSRENV